MTAAAADRGAPPRYLEPGVFDDWGLRAVVTTRAAGSFSFASAEPAHEVTGRWTWLQREVTGRVPRLASATQVHGSAIAVHRAGWRGWLRVPDADGHLALHAGIALAVTVADCVPVFLAHPSGVAALLHSGWRGTAAGITEHAIRALADHGLAPSTLRLYLGPAVCGACYEVGEAVHAAVTGTSHPRPSCLDLRASIADRGRAAGVRDVLVDDACTRCQGDRFFSHRAGDAGRQLAVFELPT